MGVDWQILTLGPSVRPPPFKQLYLPRCSRLLFICTHTHTHTHIYIYSVYLGGEHRTELINISLLLLLLRRFRPFVSLSFLTSEVLNSGLNQPFLLLSGVLYLYVSAANKLISKVWDATFHDHFSASPHFRLPYPSAPPSLLR